MLYFSGIIITVFLALVLVGKKHKTTADIILLAWLLVIAFHLLLYYLFITGKVFSFPWLLGWNLPLPLFHGPLLFLYTAALTEHKDIRRPARMIHLLPPLLFYVPLIPFLLEPAAEKISVFRRGGEGHEQYLAVLKIAIIVSGILYVTLSLWLLRNYRKTLQNEFSFTEKINLNWLRYLIYSIALIWVFVIIGNDPLVFGSAAAFVFVLGFFGFRQPGVFSGLHVHTINGESDALPTQAPLPPASQTLAPGEIPENETIHRTEPTSSKGKYEKSGLSADQAGDIYRKLTRGMDQEKYYTNPELTLDELSGALGVYPNHLSQVINTYEKKSFYDFINHHRVEEFKRVAPLEENARYTLLSLSYDCGFNSKTSFNRNFKKSTGISPSEYLRQQQIHLNPVS